VAAIGPGVREVAVGDRVAVYHHAGCGTCPQCQAYRIQYCPRLRAFGRTHHGSNAEYMLAPALHCHHVPASVTFEDAALVACIAGTGFSALRQLNVSAPDTVGVYGIGPVGLVTAILAKALGARVVGVEVSAGRRELARRLGVDAVIDPRDVGRGGRGRGQPRRAAEGRGVFGASGFPGQRDPAGGALGAVVYLGIGGPPFQIDAGMLIGKQLKLIGSWVQEPHEMDELFRFMAERGFGYAPMIAHRYPLRDAQAAFDIAAGRAVGRVMFTFDEPDRRVIGG